MSNKECQKECFLYTFALLESLNYSVKDSIATYVACHIFGVMLKFILALKIVSDVPEGRAVGRSVCAA